MYSCIMFSCITHINVYLYYVYKYKVYMTSQFFLYASVFKAAHQRKINHLHLVHMHD